MNMKKILFLILSILITSSLLASEKTKFISGYPIIKKKYKEMNVDFGKNLSTNMKYKNQRDIPAPKYEIDDERAFWMVNVDQGGEYIVNAVCKAISDEVYIFVNRENWSDNATNNLDNDEVNQEMVDEFFITATESVPNYPEQGFIQTEQEIFGPMPDAHDNDPRLYILLTDIKDGAIYQNGGAFVAGFFDPINQMSEAQASWYGRNSNEVEMIYIDIWPATFKDAQMTLTHEFLHLLMSNRDTEEELWLEEGMAVYAQYDMGYSPDKVYQAQGKGSYFEDFYYYPNTSLTVFDNTLQDYAESYSFVVYLSERYGKDFIYDLFKSTKHGIASIMEVLAERNIVDTFEDIFTDYTIAIYADRNDFNENWGFSTLDIGVDDIEGQNFHVAAAHQDYPASIENRHIKAYAPQYFMFLQPGYERVPLVFESQEPVDVTMIKLTGRTVADTIKVLAKNTTLFSTMVDSFFNYDSDPRAVLVVSNNSGKDTFINYRIGYSIYSDDDFNHTSFELYPNPVRDGILFLNIVEGYTDENTFGSFKIFTIDGKLAKSYKIAHNNRNGYKMDLSDLPSGLYMYYVESPSGIKEKGKFSIIR